MPIGRTLPIVCAALAALALWAGCASTERIPNQNLAHLYGKTPPQLNPELRVRHLNDTLSVIEFRIRSSDLLYVENPSSGYHGAEFRLRFDLYAPAGSRSITDSTVALFRDSMAQLSPRAIEGQLPMRAGKAQTGIIRVDIADLKRNIRTQHYLPLDRTHPAGRQFFDVREAATDAPFFGDRLKATDRVVISHASRATNATVRYYGREFPLPKPPFSLDQPPSFSYTPDSVFTIVLNQPIRLATEGMYHIQVTDSVRQGLTLYRYGEHFPEVRDIEGLLGPLRYLTSNQEFKKLASADFPKAEVDRFWLKTAGNADRARILIEKFYGRVQQSNRYFTSFTEGWRTDRGLVYLIYGPPDVMYKSADAEQWLYGDQSNPSAVSFNFSRVNNPFTDNDFRMERSQMYKSSWYRAVDMWRQGRVLLD